MRQLVLACHNYQSSNLKFPSNVIDEDGTALLSWRVQILPYIDRQDLYDQIDFTKPWNHPTNLAVGEQMPNCFICPNYKPNPNDPFDHVKTSYLAIVGEEALWHPVDGAKNFTDVTDGSSRTIALIEADLHRVHWMSPMDLPFEKIVAMNVAGETDILVSGHPGGSQVVMVDGSARFISALVTAKQLRAAATIAGGEPEEIDDY